VWRVGVTASGAKRSERGGYRREERERRGGSFAEAVAVSGAGGGSGTSLDLRKNNCNNGVESATRQSKLTEHGVHGKDDDPGGRYDCREVYSNFRVQADTTCDDEEEPPEGEFRCDSWDCVCCGYRMRMNLVEELEQLVLERPEMRRLLTLTLDPEKLSGSVQHDDGEQADYIMETWRKMRTYIRREYGDFSFVWVKEKQDNGNWHLHILVSRFLDQEWVSSAWASIGGGEIVDIQRVNRAEKVAHYVGKYLTENALSGFPDGVRRYGSSEDIELDVRGDSDSERSFSLLMDDYRITDPEGEPLTRGVVDMDFVEQKRNGGPVGKGPPPGG
jgi:hypothetical protein